MTRRRLEEEWNSYSRCVLPKDAPPIQRKECRMAFMAGCAATIGMLNIGADLSDAEQEVFMKELGQELMEMKP